MPETQLRTKVRQVVATALGLDVEHLPSIVSSDTVESWDSLGHLEIVEALSKEFGAEIPHAVAITLLSEDAIVAAVSSLKA